MVQYSTRSFSSVFIIKILWTGIPLFVRFHFQIRDLRVTFYKNFLVCFAYIYYNI